MEKKQICKMNFSFSFLAILCVFNGEMKQSFAVGNGLTALSSSSCEVEDLERWRWIAFSTIVVATVSIVGNVFLLGLLHMAQSQACEHHIAHRRLFKSFNRLRTLEGQKRKPVDETLDGEDIYCSVDTDPVGKANQRERTRTAKELYCSVDATIQGNAKCSRQCDLVTTKSDVDYEECAVLGGANEQDRGAGSRDTEHASGQQEGRVTIVGFRERTGMSSSSAALPRSGSFPTVNVMKIQSDTAAANSDYIDVDECNSDILPAGEIRMDVNLCYVVSQIAESHLPKQSSDGNAQLLNAQQESDRHVVAALQESAAMRLSCSAVPQAGNIAKGDSAVGNCAATATSPSYVELIGRSPPIAKGASCKDLKVDVGDYERCEDGYENGGNRDHGELTPTGSSVSAKYATAALPERAERAEKAERAE
eukprot:scpid77097/ scgid25422/ 